MNVSKTETKQFIEHQLLINGQSKRLDCPECGGTNTLSISKEIGDVKYFCFRANCGVRGIINSGFNANDVASMLKQQQEKKPFVLPDTFVNVERSMDAIRYLEYTGIDKTYKRGLCDVRYDVRTDRVIFIIYGTENTPVDATGRALRKGTKPKWLRYGSSGFPFLVNREATQASVVVEDAASASKLGQCKGVCGVALLGTNITTDCAMVLRNYATTYVALDFDAAHKGYSKVESMSWFNDVRFLSLTKDIKDMTDKEFSILIQEVTS